MRKSVSARVRVFLLLAASGVFIALLLLATSVRGRVLYHAWRTHSRDRSVAAQARLELRAIGRPWIDGVLPELVAHDLSSSIGYERQGCVLVGDVGGVAARDLSKLSVVPFVVREVVSGPAEVTSAGQTILLSVDTLLRASVAPKPRRALVAVVPSYGAIMSAQHVVTSFRITAFDLRDLEPLDPEDEPALLARVKERLSRR